MSGEDVVVLETGSVGGVMRGTEIETGIGTGVEIGAEAKTEESEGGKRHLDNRYNTSYTAVPNDVTEFLRFIFGLQSSFTFSR